jgi:site-specific DNA-cytosine methylase
MTTMADIRDTPWNRLHVASLFAGWGGSSLGYRLAGFRVAYANELTERAANVYRLNANGRTHVHVADMRKVPGAEILRRADLDELDLLDGSPPCPGFSSGQGYHRFASKKAREMRDLTWHFAIKVRDVQPRAFAMENVVGLKREPWLTAYLEPLVKYLGGLGYGVAFKEVVAADYGVPQLRRRVLLAGFREDVGASAADVLASIVPAPPVTVGDAIPDAETLVIEPDPAVKVTSFRFRKQLGWAASAFGPTVCAKGINMCSPTWARVETRDGGKRDLGVADLLGLSGFPPDFALTDDAQDVKVACVGAGNSVPPPMARAWGGAFAQALA